MDSKKIMDKRQLLNDLQADKSKIMTESDKKRMEQRMISAQTQRMFKQLQIGEEIEKNNAAKTVREDMTAICENEKSKELGELTRQNMVKTARSQQVRNNNHELRELERKLHSAYVAKDLKQQIQENEYRRMQEKIEKERIQKQTSEKINIEEELEYKENEIKKRAYGDALRDQMLEDARRKQLECEKNVTERQKEVENIVKRIQNDNIRDFEKKTLSQDKIRLEMEILLSVKEAKKEKEKQLQLIEEKRLKEHNRKKQENVADYEKLRNEAFAKQHKIMCSIADKITAEKTEKEEREKLLLEFYEHELLDCNIQREKHENNFVDGQKCDTRMGLKQQMAENDMKKRLEKEESVRFQMLLQENKLCLDAREFEKAKRKKEVNLQYSLDIKRQIVENRERRNRDVEVEKQRDEHMMTFRENMESNVIQERRSIVKDFTPDALGFLVPGVLTNEEINEIKKV